MRLISMCWLHRNRHIALWFLPWNMHSCRHIIFISISTLIKMLTKVVIFMLQFWNIFFEIQKTFFYEPSFFDDLIQNIIINILRKGKTHDVLSSSTMDVFHSGDMLVFFVLDRSLAITGMGFLWELNKEKKLLRSYFVWTNSFS